MDNIGAGGEQCVHCREVVHFLECPLSEVPLYCQEYIPLFGVSIIGGSTVLPRVYSTFRNVHYRRYHCIAKSILHTHTQPRV